MYWFDIIPMKKLHLLDHPDHLDKCDDLRTACGKSTFGNFGGFRTDVCQSSEPWPEKCAVCARIEAKSATSIPQPTTLS